MGELVSGQNTGWTNEWKNGWMNGWLTNELLVNGEVDNEQMNDCKDR